MHIRLITMIFITAISLQSAAYAASTESGTALKADSLKVEPYSDAKTTGNLTKGETVTILAKQGAWLKIKNKKSTGWVRLLSVKRSSTTGSQANGILNVATGRTGTGTIVATTGVRGLTAQELKDAKFNETEMNSMESYTQSSAQGQKFAAAAGLKAIKFDALPAGGK
jgi:uncharacterized protein YgiM (DUF1202 family)